MDTKDTPPKTQEEQEQDDEQFLDDCWTLYFHDPDDAEWTKNSYKIISNVSTVNDWAQMDMAFSDMWTKGMFFLMREHIQPLWEDPHNRDGGCFSFKVNKPDASAFLYKLCALMLGNTLAKSHDDVNIHNSVRGVSMSPKRNYCILRIWIGSKEYNKASLFNIDAPGYTQVLFKNHEENNAFAPPSPPAPTSATATPSATPTATLTATPTATATPSATATATDRHSQRPYPTPRPNSRYAQRC